MRRVLRKFRKWNCVDDPFRDVSGRKKLFRSTDTKVWVIVLAVGIPCAAIYTHSIQILTELVNARVDWFLDELLQKWRREQAKEYQFRLCGVR